MQLKHPRNGQILHTGIVSLASIRLITRVQLSSCSDLVFHFQNCYRILRNKFARWDIPFPSCIQHSLSFFFLIDQEKRIRENLTPYDKNTLEQCDLWQRTVWVSSIRKGKNSQTRSDQGLWNWPAEANKVKMLRGWQAYFCVFTEHFQTVLVLISSPIIPKFNFLSWALLKIELTFSLNYL